MKTKNLLYLIIPFCLANPVVAQENKIAKAEKQYDHYAYVDAIAIYEKVAEKGYKDEKLLRNLGNAYYFKAELPKAAKWYEELFTLNPEQEPEYYYRYSQSLKSIGNYAKADEMLEKFSNRLKQDIRSRLFQDQKDYLEKIKANSGRYQIENAGVNSEYSDYGSVVFDSKLIFTSARDTNKVSKRVFKWTNESFTNLYAAEIKSDSLIGKPERFSKSINSKFHESTPIFTKDGKTMYFTRNNYLNGKRGKSSQDVTLLKLYKAVFDKEWTNVQELPFNSNEYSIAHPALTPDEKTLYFSSDMPGTIGQSDIFRVEIKEDGSYGTPENLGIEINTEGKETFPFLSEDNELYFSSDGHPGLGGLDIFVAKKENNGFSNVQNAGEPLNSPQDDFAFFMNNGTRTGFFTSNKEGGKGHDDIYKFSELQKLKNEQAIAGVITNPKTGLPLAGATVSLLSDDFKPIGKITTDANGQYNFDVIPGKTYYIRADKEEYQTKEEKIQVNNISGKTEKPLALETKFKKIETNTDLAKEFDIPIIYFDLNKSFIRKDAEVELAKILVIMQQYPKMKIDIRSHTDCRQNTKYNDKLSKARASTTIAWLKKQGIEANRLSGKGYGETQLVNHCADGVKCSEEEHQANRRSEFIIVSME